MLLNWAQDPLGAITTDVGKLCAALWAELLEEALHHFQLRAEVNINDISDLRACCPKEGDPSGELAWRPS